MLRVQNITQRFEATVALDEVSLSIEPGEVHALVGENGAGKSTLGKVIAGAITPDSGEIFLNGTAVHFESTLQAQKLGIAIIFQELDLFPNLTVAENIVIGNLAAERGIFVDASAMDKFCAPLFRQVGLTCSPRRRLRELSLAQMQLVAIARALGMNARVIVMDEPTSSLSDDGVETLFGLIRMLQNSGTAIIYVSHKMDEILRIANRVSVLRDGRLISTKAATETNADEIIRMMAGRAIPNSSRAQASTPSDVLLRVESLSTSKLDNISFELHAGEVLGIAGLVGSGRSALGKALFGIDPILGGAIEIRGQRVDPKSPADALRHGLGLVPEDRKTEGLMMQMSAVENSTLGVLDELRVCGLIKGRAEQEKAAAALSRVRFNMKSRQAPVGNLSGGNQQKVLLSRWLLADPMVLFLDDPARGIDIGAKHDVYQVLDQLAAAGKGILLVSSELPELLRCSDRIMVLHDGRCQGILDRGQATEARILALATSDAQIGSGER
jgi:ABC-type sugar transport system ATPase subunit